MRVISSTFAALALALGVLGQNAGDVTALQVGAR
jgi:hypothetical protein